MRSSDTQALALELRGEVRQHLRGGRVIVAVDGAPGAGQSAFADALAAAFAEDGTSAHRASAADFAAVPAPGDRPDADVLRQELIAPFRSKAIDGFVLRPGSAPVQAPDDAVLVVDGAFLLAPELRGLWNWSVYLEVHPTSAFARLAAEGRGDADPDAAENAAVRAAVAAYRRASDPRRAASALVENTDADRPVRVFGDSC